MDGCQAEVLAQNATDTQKKDGNKFNSQKNKTIKKKEKLKFINF